MSAGRSKRAHNAHNVNAVKQFMCFSTPLRDALLNIQLFFHSSNNILCEYYYIEYVYLFRGWGFFRSRFFMRHPPYSLKKSMTCLAYRIGHLSLFFRSEAHRRTFGIQCAPGWYRRNRCLANQWRTKICEILNGILKRVAHNSEFCKVRKRTC